METVNQPAERSGNPGLVSVIVPVYNVLPYLREALDSVKAQTYSNLEILVIDDGSDDGSGSVCDQYAAQDRRIRVIHQKRKGLSAARNAGLEIMTGDAVMFLDADDLFCPDSVQILVTAMEKSQCDLVMGRFSIMRSFSASGAYPGRTGAGNSSASVGVYDRNAALCLLAEGKINHSVWNKIYRSSLWKVIRFPEGHVYEDIDTTYKIIDASEKIGVTDQMVYRYRIRPGSIMKEYSLSSIEDWMTAYDHFEAFLKSKGLLSLLQRKRVDQIRHNFLTDYYVHMPQKSTQEQGDAEVLRNRIIEEIEHVKTAEGVDGFTRTEQRMLRSAPSLFRMIYPVYHPLRRMIRRHKYRRLVPAAK